MPIWIMNNAGLNNKIIVNSIKIFNDIFIIKLSFGNNIGINNVSHA